MLMLDGETDENNKEITHSQNLLKEIESWGLGEVVRSQNTHIP